MGPTFGNPSAVASKRIQGELKEWGNGKVPEGCALESCEPFTEWVVLMQGPEGSTRIYDGEVFRLKIRFTDRYPLEAPEVVFLPESPIHPHIYTNGHICLDILYDGGNGGWSPAMTVHNICLSIRSMLASNLEKKRPTGDASYCQRVGNRSPKLTKWLFDDDRV